MLKKNVEKKTHILCLITLFGNRAVCEIMWKNTAGHRQKYGAFTLHAIYLGLPTHTQNM
jgi:hypothetical protein